jgi:hypothetical protein
MTATWREIHHMDKPPMRQLAARLFDLADALDEGESVSAAEIRDLANDAVRIANKVRRAVAP